MVLKFKAYKVVVSGFTMDLWPYYPKAKVLRALIKNHILRKDIVLFVTWMVISRTIVLN